MRNLYIAIGSFFLSTVFLASCSPIERQSIPRQDTGKLLTAGYGDVVLQVDKTRNLENAFGASDVFGRKTNEGFSQLRFTGMQGSFLSFVRHDQLVSSNETTMSRSGGIFIPNTTTTTHSGVVGTTPVYGSSTTSGGGTYIPGPKANVQTSAQDIPFSIDFSTTQSIQFEGHEITILGATPTSISYQVD